MSNKVQNVNFLPDKYKTKLTPEDIFDRIINVKIVTGKQGTEEANEEYVIRSDYECVYSNTDLENMFKEGYKPTKYIIRRCTHKPSIKVQYNRVTSDIGTEVNLFITNFFMFSSDGKLLRNFSTTDFEIKRVEITMGYWGQFQNDTLLLGKPSDLFDIKPKNGASQLILREAIIIYQEKLPPDSVLHIKGFVSNVTETAVGRVKETAYKTAVSSGDITSGNKATKIENIFYNTITRRFLREGITTKSVKSLISNADIPKFKPITDEKGFMSVSDAEQYGVKVYLSEGVLNFPVPELIDSEDNEAESVTFFVDGLTIAGVISRLESYLTNDIQFMPLDSANIIVFTNDESTDVLSLAEDFDTKLNKEEKNVFEDWYQNKIPAVYNINIGAGLSTIVCPFFAFLRPFQTLYFASRYSLTNALSSLASYDTTIYGFRALKMSLSFATVEDVNEVTITAVGIKDTKVGK